MPIAKTARDLGQIIRARRKELNLDQAQLARQVGVSRQWLIDIEKGKPRAELGLILRTLNALDLSMHLNQTITPDDRSDGLVHAPERQTSAQVDIGQIVERNTASSAGLDSHDVSRVFQVQDSILGLAKQLSADIPDDLQELVREYTSATELAKQLGKANYDPQELIRQHDTATELAKQLNMLDSLGGLRKRDPR